MDDAILGGWAKRSSIRDELMKKTDKQPASNDELRPEGENMSQSTKELLKQAVEELPDDVTVEEVMERLLFLAKIERGIAQADAGKTVSHEEVGKRLAL